MARDMSWNMSKRQALANVAICLGLAAVFFILQLSGCGTFFLLLAIWPAMVWCVKFARDQHRIDKLRGEGEQQQATLPPPMTSPGSSRLFVPPPLDRR